MTTVMNPAANPERLAFPRLLVRSLILGSVVPVTQGEFWDVKAVQIVLALVLCIVLYGVEKAVLYPFRKHVIIRPLQAAAYRGALLYGLLIFGFTGDWAQSLGAGLGGALIAMLLFWLEGGALKLIYRTPSSSSLR